MNHKRNLDLVKINAIKMEMLFFTIVIKLVISRGFLFRHLICNSYSY